MVADEEDGGPDGPSAETLKVSPEELGAGAGADAGSGGAALEGAKAALGGGGGFEVLRQKQLMRAALFGRPSKPMALDRYQVLRELGAGGMGIVYLAYDDQLDRRVAVKLLRGTSTSASAKTRLQREAQAMAQLSHPNVVTVYEVGTFEGQLFVAMEYVAGQDLGSWLAAQTHAWREVLEVFLPAGAGLAAAHEAGIVHRDFKPDNVLVGDDGRVRVADFGLAYGAKGGARTPEPADAEPAPLPSDSQSLLDSPLTRTGALLGTPAYMPPEQFLGAATDARSDQFSFCVALWQALYGRRPFAGGGIQAVAAAVLEGKIDVPPPEARKGVPEWLREVLTRGLAREPDQRWPDMGALLEALADDPELRRRRRLRVAGLATLTLAALGLLGTVAARELRENQRQRYWNQLTAGLLAVERERGLAQAMDDARRARDATKLSAYRSYQTRIGAVDQEDPALAAALLREVSEPKRGDEAWISAANLSLGRPLSHAVLEDHRDTITALRYAPDAPVLYSASADGEVRRWDIETGAGQLLHAHEAGVNTLDLSRDGTQLLSSSDDGSVRLWSAQSEAVEIVARHPAPVSAARFAPSAGLIASSSRDGAVRLTALDGGSTPALAGHARGANSLRFEPGGARLVSVSSEPDVRIWDVASGELLARLDGHSEPVYHADFAADGRLVTAADDGRVLLWDLAGLGSDPTAALAEPVELTRHDAAISALSLRGAQVGSGAVDGSVRVTGLEAPGAAAVLPGHAAGVWGLTFDGRGEQLISASRDGSARVSRVDGRGPSLDLRGHREALLRLALDPSGRWLATGAYDSDVRLWDLARPRLELPLRGHRAVVHHVEVDGVGQRVLSASADGSLRIWDAQTGVMQARLQARESWNAAVFAPAGDRVAAGSNHGNVVVWDPASDARLRLEEHRDAIRSLVFTPDGKRLISASSDHDARLWDLATGRSKALRGHEDIVSGLGLDPGTRTLATISFDGDLRLWDLASGELLAVLEGHQKPIRALARNPRGGWASAGDDREVRLWPDRDPSHAQVLRGHTMKVVHLDFDASGQRLASSSADGSVRVWDAREGALLHVLEGHDGTVWGARFVAEDRLLSYADDNRARLWLLPTEANGLSEARAIVLSGHEASVVDLALAPGGAWAVTASADASARIWSLSLLSHDPDQLHRRLLEANISCLGLERRRRDLGEDPQEAEAAHAACERSFGR